MPQFEIRYVELKTGYSDDGPAWIGRVKLSKSGNTVYFNDKAFRKSAGINSNYRDVETGERYWISGVKTDGCDRHWAGKGKIIIDRKIIGTYLTIIGASTLDDQRLIVEDIEDRFPEERIYTLENAAKGQ